MEFKQSCFSRWYYFVLPPTILSIVTTVVYYPSLHYDFQFDDIANITKHFSIRHYSFSQLFFNSTRWISYWLNSLHYKIGKFDPFSYRVGDLIIHTVNGILVFFILFIALSGLKNNSFFKRNNFFIALLTSTFFLLHPVQSQTVSYVIQGQLEGMATLFVLGMVLCFLLIHRTHHTIQRYVLTGLLFILAFFSCGTKEIAIVSPILLILVDWFFIAQGSWNELKKRTWLHVALFVLVTSIYIYLLKPHFFIHILGMQAVAKNNIGNIITKNPLDKITPSIFFISQFKVILHYLWIFIYPLNISVEYDWKLVEDFFAPDCILPFIALVSIGFFVIRLLIKNPTNLISFGMIWFAICIAPRSSIIASPELIADYKTYMSSFGWLFLIAAGLIKLGELVTNKIKNTSWVLSDVGIQAATAFIFALLLGTLTNQRNRVWSSGLNFWGNIIKNAPGKARAYNNYGVDLSQKYAKFKEAVPYFKKAIAMDKHYPDPCNNLAVAYARLGNLNGAINSIKQGLRINPYYPEGYNNLASFLLQQKKYDTAKKALEAAIKLRPYYGKAYYNLGRLYIAQKNNEKAWECFKKCCTEGDLDNVGGFSIYAKVSLSLKKYDDAITGYTKALELDPANQEIAFNLGNVYYLAKKYEQAIDIYKRILQHNPNNARVLHNTGEAYCKLNNPAKAINCFKQVPHIKKRIPQMYLRMASCYEQLGEIENAKQELNEAIKQKLPENIKKLAQQFLKKLNGSVHTIAATKTKEIFKTATV